MEPKHLISIRDLTADDVSEVFRITSEMKASPDKFGNVLAGKSLALLFQKPSTRTRVSFQGCWRIRQPASNARPKQVTQSRPPMWSPFRR